MVTMVTTPLCVCHSLTADVGPPVYTECCSDVRVHNDSARSMEPEVSNQVPKWRCLGGTLGEV